MSSMSWCCCSTQIPAQKKGNMEVGNISSCQSKSSYSEVGKKLYEYPMNHEIGKEGQDL